MKTLLLALAISVPAFAVTGKRSFELEGEIDSSLSFFVESIYIGANFLDPLCLLRYPNGQFGPVMQSFPVTPAIENGRYTIKIPIDHYEGDGTCQFRFISIKFWIAPKGMLEKEFAKDNFIAIVPEGTASGGEPVSSIEVLEGVLCKEINPTTVDCSFQTADGKQKILAISSAGTKLRDVDFQN